MSSTKKTILVGLISSAYGVQGYVAIKSFTSPMTNITKMKLVNEAEEEVKLVLIRQNSKGHLICKFNEINTRSEAEKLKNYKIFCYRAALPPTEEEEFYISDLNNLPVVTSKLIPLGVIKNIYNFGAGDIIEIEFEDKKVELFPFTKKFFPIVTKEYLILHREDLN